MARNLARQSACQCCYVLLCMTSGRLNVLAFALLIICPSFPLLAQALSDAHDHSMPTSGQITVSAEGGLTFQMKVNGQGPFATVFDTGAVNIISTAFANQLGLKIEDKPIDMGAIGGSVKVRTAHIDTLSIGDLIIRNQTFFVLDIPSGTGVPQMLVGWEVLQSFAVRIDFASEQLTFIDLADFSYSGGGASVPLKLNKHGNGIFFDAKVDGIKGRFQLDSGNETGLFLNAGFVNKHHLQKKLHATLRGYNGKGMGGDAPDAWFARLHTLELGGIALHDPVVRLVTGKDKQKLAGNIGQSTLKHFTVTIDCRHRVMYLEKLPDWDQRELFSRAGFLYDEQNDGDQIKTVFPGGAAEAAGLKAGDLITAINGAKPADDPHDPAFTQPVGTVLHLVVRRNGVQHAYDIKLRDVL
jgi:Aspartyl protease/PDZ domain